jgi:hypothetical protein
MSPTPANPADLSGARWFEQAANGLNRTPRGEMMTEDAKFALGF